MGKFVLQQRVMHKTSSTHVKPPIKKGGWRREWGGINQQHKKQDRSQNDGDLRSTGYFLLSANPSEALHEMLPVLWTKIYFCLSFFGNVQCRTAPDPPIPPLSSCYYSFEFPKPPQCPGSGPPPPPPLPKCCTPPGLTACLLFLAAEQPWEDQDNWAAEIRTTWSSPHYLTR